MIRILVYHPAGQLLESGGLELIDNWSASTDALLWADFEDEPLERERELLTGRTQYIVGALLTSMLLTAGCVSVGPSDHPGAVEEIMPGLLQGYLAQEEIPDSLKTCSRSTSGSLRGFRSGQGGQRG